MTDVFDKDVRITRQLPGAGCGVGQRVVQRTAERAGEIEIGNLSGTPIVVKDRAGRCDHHGRKLATTDFALSMVTRQSLPLTESHPVHPLKSDARFAVGVSVTTVPRLKKTEHFGSQLIPAGFDVTVPPPRPSGPLVLLTVSSAVTV